MTESGAGLSAFCLKNLKKFKIKTRPKLPTGNQTESFRETVNRTLLCTFDP